MTTVHTLASGSSGNALLLSCGEAHLLVDAGISCRRITAGLREVGLTTEDLSAVLITHTHTDHIAGLQTLLKHTHMPVFGSGRTCRELNWRFAGMDDRLQELPLCQEVSLGVFRVTAFPISHDAPGACGFRIDTENGSLGIITDTGYVTEEATRILPGVDLAVLEANHDVECVRSGPYPYYLKQRILGREGHLSNEDAGQFAVVLAAGGASCIVLAHLSQENNTPAMAYHAVELSLSAAGLYPRERLEEAENGIRLTVAPRDRLSEAYPVCGRNVCRK